MNSPSNGPDPAGSPVLERQDLDLPSALESVELLEETAEAMALRAGLDADTASHIAMVTREAAINAVKHGNQFAAEKQVHASVRRTAGELVITVADEGPGVDLSGLPDPLDPANLLRTSGRGVFLMRAFMDEVHFRNQQPGTEITLVKRLSTEASS